jgi:sortase A
VADQHWAGEDAEDDVAFLAQLLTTQRTEQAAQRRRLRPVALQSTQQLRKEALSGYRFRTRFDHFLTAAERMLGLAVALFFVWWLYDGYGKDLIHALRAPARAEADLSSVSPGTTAAELADQLGGRLPSSGMPGDTPAAPRPDYLIPAQGFVLPPVPTATARPEDPRPTRLLVPAMQLDTPVAEVFLQEGEWQVADYAAGYHHGTALPGKGNTVLAGHAGIRGAVFAYLYLLQPGDDIYLDTPTTRYHYRVRSITSVWPTQVEVMYPTQEPIITMITCTAWDTQRLIVVADLADTAPLAH